MSAPFSVYWRWIRDRRLSTFSWTAGSVLMIVATAAFYPSLGAATASIADGSAGGTLDSVLGLSSSIDPSSPLGYLWISLYANVLPWTLMALGVALGTAAIAGDEDTGALEYLLSGPITRTQVVFARFAGAVSILLLVSFVSGLSLVLSMPFFELSDSVTTTASDGTTTTAPGATVGDIAAGTFSSFAVALGLTGIAFLIGGVTGRKGVTLGGASAIGIGGYVLYTLSSTTSSLEFLTWLSPWRWYVDDVMLIDGLTWDVTLPFGTATIGLIVGWQAFLHRDLQSS